MCESRGLVILWHAENLKIAKSFGPCQPARTAQADMRRYFSQNALSFPFTERGSCDNDRNSSDRLQTKATGRR